LKKLPRSGLALVDVPHSLQEVQALMNETRQRGLARVVHSLLPGVGGFCAPVFDAQGRLALGLVVLGSVATLDTEWTSAPAAAVLRSAHQLSADLGHRPPAQSP
ncbi:MAG: IclR family transcriptional regulator, partial [Hydrogenophaga sp.]|nr:IclR family transcriptional regulator [Hydrogenophaga sp.]